MRQRSRRSALARPTRHEIDQWVFFFGARFSAGPQRFGRCSSELRAPRSRIKAIWTPVLIGRGRAAYLQLAPIQSTRGGQLFYSMARTHLAGRHHVSNL